MSKKILALLMVILVAALLAPSLAFAVEVSLTLSSNTASPGEQVTASGTADADEFVSIKVLDGAKQIIVFDAIKSDAQGHYSKSFVVPPDCSSSTLTIVAGYGENVDSQVLTISGAGGGADAIAPDWPAGSALTASGISQADLTLTWTSATDNVGVTGYKVLKDGSFYTTVASGALTCKVTGLSSSTSYTFKVEAVDAAGNWSDTGPHVTAVTKSGSGSSGGGSSSVGSGSSALPAPGATGVATVPQSASTQLFSDVPASYWGSDVIAELSDLGYISGYPDGSFKPDNTITRAELATVLVKAFQLPVASGKVFDDTANHWAQNYIAGSYAAGIVSGYSESSFGPDDPVTREQIAVMIVKAAKISGATEDIPFADGDNTSAWAKDSLAAVVQNGIMKGYPDNTFAPKHQATRAEAVMVIANALK